ncbi:MAG: excinuclease ABC subunit UvrC [Candidatus Azobacteroides sp.]|nr:excinuclease ABC subunit UvrC [Candidatus Azobacteroides sp.]
MNSNDNTILKNIITNLPEKAGVYQFFDINGTIIYVGKAKNLKKRVSSYFNKNHEYGKTKVLVKKIKSIQYIIVENENDALLLENNLIKKHRPRYNVLLKDDKTYPSICITKEHFPRIYKTRDITKKGNLYFGPYSSANAINILLDLIKELYPIRTCHLNLSPERIKERKYKVCLEYHIKNCLGPCEELQKEEDYNKNIKDIIEIIKGNAQEISNLLYDEMKSLAKELKFEEAQKIKHKYELIEQYKTKSIIVSPTIKNTDVFSCEVNDKAGFINYLHIINGTIVQGYTFEYKKKLEETKEELLALGIAEIQEKYKKKFSEIIVPFLPENAELFNATFTIPQKGDKKKLLDLSVQNVKQYKFDRLKQEEKLNPEQRTIRILTTLQKDLQLKEIPWHIECFDNSNIQGTNPVSACVVFKKAKPSKRDYRHFNIKTVEGPNDFASMKEVVYRRYKRLSEENQSLPQLIVIDGGKGQLSSSKEALEELGLYGKIAIIGIAKRLEEIFFPEDSIPIYLDKNSESLKLIQKMRDEAHRFGITHHRNKRSKKQTTSALDAIKGIGDKTKELLLKEFKSIKRIKEAPEEELIKLIGRHKTEIVKKELKNNS